MDQAARMRDIASDLLQQSQMSEHEVTRRAALAVDAAYWRGLAPSLSSIPIDATASQAGSESADASVSMSVSISMAHAQLADDGYFEIREGIDAETLVRLNEAIDAVVAAGWPAAFAWMYDDAWRVARASALASLLTHALGRGYAQIPHIWVHVVPAAAGASGWMPHLDGPPEGRVSVWVALSDATLSNGCMHLVPRRLLPASFLTASTTASLQEGNIPLADALRALQSARAWPVAAGTVLGWTFDTLHWGGLCTTPATPRRAVSMEFLAPGQEALASELPLVPVTGELPTLPQRLRMIATALRAYAKFEPGLIRYRALADRLNEI